MLNQINYNPDVLDCLANLSSDEVFTSPKLASEILDLLPQELFQDKQSTFLDPVTKTGVFLREVTKRLMDGLESEIPDKEKRIKHILHNQVFGIAITELTSLVARRSVYCSKIANGRYSICPDFKTDQGNIIFESMSHKWKGESCKYCGASKKNYDRSSELESHAYQFIHTENPKELFNMKFDVIVGNPPYQLDTGGSGRQAKPIYHKFVTQAKKLNPKHLIMIIPSRWFAGGMGLKNFREEMLGDNRISHLVDFTNAKDCFPGVSLSGGVNYFLMSKDYSGDCNFTSIHNGKSNTLARRLNDFSVLVRYNEAVKIIDKVQKLKEKSLSSIISSIDPFGFATSERGISKEFNNSVKLYSSGGYGFVSKNNITQSKNLLEKYKVMISQTTSEHAGESGKDGKFKLLSTVRVLEPNEICTFSYITAGSFETKDYANNLKSYLLTSFSRFLILQAITSIHISKEKFIFLPLQDFSENWSDEKLFKKYSLNEQEVEFIESMIRPMQ